MEIWNSLEIITSLIFSKHLLTASKSGVQLKHYAADCMPSFNKIVVDNLAALFSCTAMV